MRDQTVGSAFKIGHCAHDDWRKAVDGALDDLGAIPAGANIGFLYATDLFASVSARMLDYVRRKTGIEAIVGTVGIGVIGNQREYFEEGAVSLMVGALPEKSFTLFDRPDRRQDGKPLKGWFGIVHADPRAMALPELIADFAEASGAYLVGGLTSSRGDSPQFAGVGAGGSLSGVLFDETVPVAMGLTQGCVPLGTTHRITECSGNIIVTLDGRPAYEVMKSEVGEARLKDLQKLGSSIMVGLPVSGSDKPDYLVRNLMGVDPRNGMIAVGGLVDEGQGLMFCRRDEEAAAADLDRMLRDLRRRTGTGTPKGAIYFSCLGRGPSMFDEGGEVERIRAALGDIPLTGFYCNGEIANGRLYGYTGVLTVFL